MIHYLNIKHAMPNLINSLDKNWLFLIHIFCLLFDYEPSPNIPVELVYFFSYFPIYLKIINI